jgi:two-component system invasion response regulator UvrY
MSIDRPIRIALVDDHTLFRKGLIRLIELSSVRCEILFEAEDGMDMQKKLGLLKIEPEIILMDINMKVMDGFASVLWLNKHYPEVKVLVVSMVDHEESVLKMIKLGVKGYLGKDVEPAEMGNALHAIYERGFYYTDIITGKLVHSLQISESKRVGDARVEQLGERESEFLKLACSELTYHEIAARMFLSPKTIDGYRISLFEKFGVKTRVGLAIYAIRNNLVKLAE